MDRTYEILKVKYAPHLVEDVPEPVAQLVESPLTLEAFTLQVRKSYLESCGLSSVDRHQWADNIVVGMAVLQLEQFLGMELR